MTLTVQASVSYIQALSKSVTFVNGKSEVVQMVINTMSIIYATVQFPVYLITASHVELIVVAEKENPLGMSNALFIGMVAGCAIVVCLLGYMAVWLVRRKNDPDSGEYSYTGDIDDNEQWEGDEVQHHVGSLWDGKNVSDSDSWLDL